MKKIHLQTGLMMLLFSGLMLACRPSTPEPTATVPVETAAVTSSLIPSLTMTPAPTATPTITLTPTHTPTPANPIAQWDFYHFTPGRDNLESGEYVLVQSEDYDDRDNNRVTVSFISWDLKQNGIHSFFEYVDTDPGFKPRGFFIINNVILERSYLPVKDGLYTLSLDNYEERFFGHNCGFENEFYHGGHGQDYYYYICDATPDDYGFENGIIHIISAHDFNTVKVLEYPDEPELMERRGWDGNRLMFESPGYRGRDLYLFCYVEPPGWEMICPASFPFHVYASDNQQYHTWVRSRESESGLAYIKRECLQDKSIDCEPVPVLRPEIWKEQILPNENHLFWTPDGRKLIVVEISYIGEQATWVWYYDVATGVSHAVVQMFEVYQIPVRNTLSPDGNQFLLEDSTMDEKILLISLEGSPSFQVLPLRGRVAGSISVR